METREAVAIRARSTSSRSRVRRRAPSGAVRRPMGFAGRLAVTLISAILLSGAAYAFTASNIVSATTAGNGSGGISGYTVSNVSYAISGAINAAKPLIEGVSFTLTPKVSGAGAPAPNNVSATITSSGDAVLFDQCTLASGTWSCTSSSGNMIYVSSADTLYVTAAQ